MLGGEAMSYLVYLLTIVTLTLELAEKFNNKRKK